MTFLRSIIELGSQGKPPPQNLEKKQIQRSTAKISLLGTEELLEPVTGRNTYGNFGELLETEWGIACELKTPGDPVLGGLSPTLSWGLRPEAPPSSYAEDERKIPSRFGPLRETANSSPLYLPISCQGRGQGKKKKKKRFRTTSEGHKPGTQAY